MRERRRSFRNLEIVTPTAPTAEDHDHAPRAGHLPSHDKDPTTPPPLSAPPVLPRMASVPCIKPERKRTRFFSEDLHTRARRFGTPVTVLVATNPETSRRQLEVVVHVQYFKKGAAPLVFIMELRRLLFWAVLMCACVTSTSAFRAVPRTAPPQLMASQATPTSLGASSALNSIGLGEEMGQLHTTLPRSALMDEASVQLGKVGELAFGADSFDVSAVASQLLAMVSEGELTMEKMKTYFTRACMSAVMHKVVGGGMTLASCLAHMPQ